jgi:hypothetical protein
VCTCRPVLALVKILNLKAFVSLLGVAQFTFFQSPLYPRAHNRPLFIFCEQNMKPFVYLMNVLGLAPFLLEERKTISKI